MTATCLDNLRHQRFTDYEVLLVENGSTDDTLEYLRKHYQDYPNLTILPQSRNLGFDGGCNAGIRAAKGEFFALLNSDAAPQPDWLELLVKRMDTSTQIAIVQPKVLQTRTASDGSHLIDTTGDFYHIWGLPHPRGRDEADHGQYDQPEQIFAANAAAALYRASVFAQVGAFDEEYFLYYEDVDISFRARLAGYEVWYEPAAVVYHEVGGTSGGHETNPLTRYHMPKNLWYLYLCDMPARLFWRYLWRFAFFFSRQMSRIVFNTITVPYFLDHREIIIRPAFDTLGFE